MKKEQLTIPLVFLGIVAIIAVIGLILLVMKPSGTGLGIGASYRGGIAIASEIPPYMPGGPSQQFPAYQGGVSTRGTRTPVMVFFRGEYGNINEASKCWADLWPLLPIPKEVFSCYVVPTTLPHTVFLTLIPFAFFLSPTPCTARILFRLVPSTSFLIGNPQLSDPPVTMNSYPASPSSSPFTLSPIFLPISALASGS